jgi:hypothetical protein
MHGLLIAVVTAWLILALGVLAYVAFHHGERRPR